MQNKEILRKLQEYNKILDELQAAGVLNSANLVSSYGEYVACKRLHLTRNSNSNQKGYDALDKKDKKYQIKARKDSRRSKGMVFLIKREKIKDFNYLILVKFDFYWDIKYMLKLSQKDAKREWSNGRINETIDLVKKFKI